ncbi:MAG: hypothetical protein IJ530_09155 [Treponema sp.]|uniref:hypothetical protein n=1 Tax=Treponema sp. TaxID=166 RepID=UPI0025D7A929|nr:hypothetical protein [Treponema sp.]MBQ8679922.1 hypothetical protein [Treponema sp.]
MSTKNQETFILTGILEKDAEPILSEDKELGCLLTVKKGEKVMKVEIFSELAPVLYRHALKGIPVVIPVWRTGREHLYATIAYPL